MIAIIGLLSTIVLASMNTARQKARDAARISDIRQIQTALEEYASDNGHYPISNSAWTSFDSTNGAGYYSKPIFSPAATNITTAMAPYISGAHDPSRPTNDGGYLYRADAGGKSYCLMIWRTPENMKDFPASMIPPRCGTVLSNGNCSAGGNAVYVGAGTYEFGVGC